MNDAHALVIGIADYQFHSKLSVVRDAQDFAAVLRDPAQCGYAPENVQLLLDEQASAAAIRAGLARLAQRAVPKSTVMIYFSGHGGQVESGPSKGEYLLPWDSAASSPEAMAKSSISGQELTAALQAIAALQVVVVFDCCHAGGIGQPKDSEAGDAVFTEGLSDSFYEVLHSGRGCVILAATRGSEDAIALRGQPYGLFTQHLLDGLRGGVASEDGLIHIFDLFEYLQPLVTSANPLQHPVFKAQVEQNFPIAHYRGGQKGVIPRDGAGFRYDAYVSYVDRDPDAGWVWDKLLPRLKAEGLRVAVSGDVGELGVARVVNMERGITQAKRTLLVLSPAYLNDQMADFESNLSQWQGIKERTARLVPVKFADVDLPPRLDMLELANLSVPARAEREMTRLLNTLKAPLTHL